MNESQSKTAVAELPLRAGVFSTVEAAEHAVGKLLAAGFTAREISVLCSDPAKERHFRLFEHQEPAGTFVPGAAAAGTAIGVAIGGLAVVAGLATGAGVIVLAAGGLALWTGGVVGGLIGMMMTRGVERELANFYDQALTAGKLLVAVDIHNEPERLKLAEQILAEAGAEPIALPEG